MVKDKKESGQDTDCALRRRLSGGLHGTQAMAASRVLILLDHGRGRGRIVSHLLDAFFFLRGHGADTESSTMDGTVACTGGTVQCGIIEAVMMPMPPCSSS